MKYIQKKIVNYHNYAADITRDEGLKLMKATINNEGRTKARIIGSCFSLFLAVLFILIILFLYPAGW